MQKQTANTSGRISEQGNKKLTGCPPQAVETPYKLFLCFKVTQDKHREADIIQEKKDAKENDINKY